MTEHNAEYVPPPDGWFTFGTLVDFDGPVEFSTETDEAGMPLWERPDLYRMGPDGGCPTEGCLGDVRYAAPGRRHIEGCTFPHLTPVVEGSDG